MTHLTKRSSVYYFRRKIPLELQAFFDGKAEITFSLKTKSRAEAEPLSRKWSVFYDEQFAEANRIALQAPNAVSASPTPNSVVVEKPKLTDGLEIEHFDILVSRYMQKYRQLRENFAGDPKAYQAFTDMPDTPNRINWQGL